MLASKKLSKSSMHRHFNFPKILLGDRSCANSVSQCFIIEMCNFLVNFFINFSQLFGEVFAAFVLVFKHLTFFDHICNSLLSHDLDIAILLS